MSEVDVRVDITQIDAVLRGFVSRSKNIDESFIAQVLSTAVDDVIQSQGRDGTDGPWDEMKRATWSWNPRRKGGALLQATGLLANMQDVSGDGFAKIKSPAPYAHWHVTGTKHMAQRNFLAIDLAKASNEIGDYLTAEIV